MHTEEILGKTERSLAVKTSSPVALSDGALQDTSPRCFHSLALRTAAILLKPPQQLTDLFLAASFPELHPGPPSQG